MKLAIHSLSTWDVPNLRVWCPEDDTCFAETVSLAIGPRPGHQTDNFSIRVATPKGLEALEAVDGILATGPLLVLVRYDFDALWAWVTRTVKQCEAPTWPDCAHKLQRYFAWEYDNYRSP